MAAQRSRLPVAIKDRRRPLGRAAAGGGIEPPWRRVCPADMRGSDPGGPGDPARITSFPVCGAGIIKTPADRIAEPVGWHACCAAATGTPVAGQNPPQFGIG